MKKIFISAVVLGTKLIVACGGHDHERQPLSFLKGTESIQTCESESQESNECYSRYLGFIDFGSLQFLGHDGAELKPDAGLDVETQANMNEQQIKTVPRPIDLEVTQTPSDKNSAIILKKIVAPPFPNPLVQPNQHDDRLIRNTHTFNRTYSEGCPDSVICVDQMQIVFDDQDKDPQTYCIYDEDNQSTTWIPMGFAPGSRFESLAQAPKAYGPYIVRRYGGEGIECSNPGLAPSQETRAQVTISIKRRHATPGAEKFDQSTAYPIDFEAVVKVDRIDKDGKKLPHNIPPYVDHSIGLQSSSAYYFNEETGKIVKVKKKIREVISDRQDQENYLGITLDINFLLFSDNKGLQNLPSPK